MFPSATDLRQTGSGSLVDDSKEFLHIERFREVGAGPCRHQALDLARGGVGADDDHGMSRVAFVALQAREHLPAGQIGQVQIQQDQIGGMLAGQLDSQLALHRGDELDVGLVGQHLLDQREIGKVVLDIENGALVRIGSVLRMRSVAFRQGHALERRFRPGQLHPKHAAAADNAVDPDRPVHGVNQTLAKRQAKACPFHSGLFRAQAIEGRKQSGQLFRRRCRLPYR